jgi:2-keto-4-pentenoate hydratase/2-oxohepta-3-ene-1,7-dioic acid hydratase in catechol pathway
MKLVRYLSKISEHENVECYGFLISHKAVDLHRLAGAYNMEFPPSLSDFIALGPGALKRAERLLEHASKREIADASLPADQVRLLAPIAFPPKIICLGLNYRDHVSETGGTIPDEPVIFMKPHTAIIGPNEKIVKPSFVEKLDYEAELAVVIGRQVKNVSVSKASACIFGYTIFNDVSARDIQFKDKQWTRGKGFDTFAPTGPCVVTADQLQDVSNLSIRTWVNRELRQDSTTSNMVFDVYEIVHHLSRVMTLEPCDIIATGTPSGVGFAMKPQAKFLHAGDSVRIEIEKIGTLENMVVEEGHE